VLLEAQSRSKYSRRRISSNQARYEEREEADERPINLQALIEVSALDDRYARVRLRGEKEWDEEAPSPISLDCEFLGEQLLLLPVRTRLQIDDDPEMTPFLCFDPIGFSRNPKLPPKQPEQKPHSPQVSPQDQDELYLLLSSTVPASPISAAKPIQQVATSSITTTTAAEDDALLEELLAM
jgi:hypothetical protein